MSVLYLTAGGVLDFRLNEVDEARNPIPAGSQRLIRFDEDVPANRSRLAHVIRITGRYTILPGPVLALDGAPVVGFPAPGGAAFQDREAWRGLLAKAADPGSTITQADLKLLIRVVERRTRLHRS